MPFDTDQVNSAGSIAPLTNVVLFSELMERVKNRKPGLPGLGTFYGPSGFGKTRAAIWAANYYRAYYVQIKSLWTRKALCEAILKEMSVKSSATMSAMLDQIGEQLMLSGRPLIVDEADYLASKGMIEVIRDIYESSDAPIILIGEEGLPTKLRAWERVHGRMLDWIAAQPASMEDTQKLAGHYARGVTVAADLLAALHEASAGSVRRVCVNLDQVREAAEIEGWTAITLAQWQSLERPFFTGMAPGVRRGV